MHGPGAVASATSLRVVRHHPCPFRHSTQKCVTIDTGHANSPGHNVLSNNDGCAVARSAEAKALGIPMGEPWFKLKAGADRI